MNRYDSKISSKKIVCLGVIFAVLFISNLYLMTKASYVPRDFLTMPIFYKYLIPYLMVNVSLHELSHIKALNHFGKRHDKIGLKLNYWIFPSVYVELNEVHLIQKNEKIIVHLAGMYCNYFLISLIEIFNLLCLNNIFLSACFLVFSYSLLWNLIPALNSDGYKLLLVFSNINELENKKKNHLLIKMIQVVSIFLAIQTFLRWLF